MIFLELETTKASVETTKKSTFGVEWNRGISATQQMDLWSERRIQWKRILL